MSQPKIGAIIKWINGHSGEEHIGYIDSVSDSINKGVSDYCITWFTKRSSNHIRPVIVSEFTYGHTWFVVED